MQKIEDVMAATPEELNQIGINRIIESAARLGKGLDKPARQQIYNAAAAVIAECRLSEDDRCGAERRLAEALNI